MEIRVCNMCMESCLYVILMQQDTAATIGSLALYQRIAFPDRLRMDWMPKTGCYEDATVPLSYCLGIMFLE